MKALARVLTLTALAALCACNSASNSWHTLQGVAWTTTFSIKYRGQASLADSVQPLLRAVELSLSAYCGESSVTALNAATEPVEMVDTMLLHLFRRSCQLSGVTSGAFDPTVAPLVRLWGFGSDSDSALLGPTPEQIDSVMAFVGIDGCSVSPQGVITKKHPLTTFNFSAIAKGYGCDLIAAMLSRNGSTDYMIEIGGEIVVAGENPRGELWHIQVDAPVACDTAVIHQCLTILELTGCAVATSGNYRNYHSWGDSLVGHTINPATGRPASSRVLSATVIAPDCTTADALATAAMVMAPDSALALARKVEGTEVLLTVADANHNSFITLSSNPYRR